MVSECGLDAVCSTCRSILLAVNRTFKAPTSHPTRSAVDNSQNRIPLIRSSPAHHTHDAGQRVSAVAACPTPGSCASWIKGGVVNVTHYLFNDECCTRYRAERYPPPSNRIPWPYSNSVTSTGLHPSSTISSATCSTAKCTRNPWRILMEMNWCCLWTISTRCVAPYPSPTLCLTQCRLSTVSILLAPVSGSVCASSGTYAAPG